MEYQIINVQAAIIFVNPLSIDFDYTKFIVSVKDNFENFKGIMPFTIPGEVNGQLPVDVPRLTYQNNKGQLLISASRIDYMFQIQSNVIDTIKLNLDKMEKMIEDLQINNGYRVGLVLTCSIKQEDMLSEIKKLIKFDDFSNNSEIQFSYLKNTSEDKISLNEWVRYFYNKAEITNNFIIDINNTAYTPFSLYEKHKGRIIKRMLEVLGEIEGR